MHMLSGEISSNIPESMGTDKLCLRNLPIALPYIFACFLLLRVDFP